MRTRVGEAISVRRAACTARKSRSGCLTWVFEPSIWASVASSSGQARWTTGVRSRLPVRPPTGFGPVPQLETSIKVKTVSIDCCAAGLQTTSAPKPRRRKTPHPDPGALAAAGGAAELTAGTPSIRRGIPRSDA
jgi:hypothetical protein